MKHLPRRLGYVKHYMPKFFHLKVNGLIFKHIFLSAISIHGSRGDTADLIMPSHQITRLGCYHSDRTMRQLDTAIKPIGRLPSCVIILYSYRKLSEMSLYFDDK